ncbi:MAG TPA: ABC transporter permease, partial [Candidatus Cloacimonadota bacterium]|nr:ABC transporter permease [Candidatus Cloacimonadota bacterium]
MLFEGYERALKDSILNFNAHIYFFKPGLYDLQNSDIERIEKYLKEQQEYVSSQAVINGQGMLSIGSSLKGVNYRSIDDKRTDLPVSYREIIAEGTHLLEQENDIVIGKELADTYNIALNDTIFILSGADQRTSFSSLQQLPLRVVGTFKTGMYEYDMKNIFVSQEESQKLTKRKSGMNEYNLIEVRIKTEDIEKAREIALKWEKEFH